MSHGNLKNCRICFNKVICRSLRRYESFCDNCFRQYITLKLYDADIQSICYPECTVPISESKLRSILPNRDFLRYAKIKLLLIHKAHKRFCRCPKLRCKGFDFSLQNNRYICAICDYPFCFVCKNEFIGDICLKCLNRRKCRVNCCFFIWKLFSNSKECPNCKILTLKNEGCKHMTCTRCGYSWCWICRRRYQSHDILECMIGKRYYNLNWNFLIFTLMFPISLFFIFYIFMWYRITNDDLKIISQKYHFITLLASFILSPGVSFIFLSFIISLKIHRHLQLLSWDDRIRKRLVYFLDFFIFFLTLTAIIFISFVFAFLMPPASVVFIIMKFIYSVKKCLRCN